jgi:hypothetical protein
VERPGPQQSPNFLALEEAVIGTYKQGGMTLALDLVPLDLSHLGGIPTGEVLSSPAPTIWVMGFNPARRRTECAGQWGRVHLR